MKEKCCICGKDIIGFGNNPYPIKEEGVCCDECNTKVIIARLSGIKNKGYAVLEYSEEDFYQYSLVSLHDTEDNAIKKCKYLNKRNEGLKHFVGGYFTITTEELLTNKKYAYLIDMIIEGVE